MRALATRNIHYGWVVAGTTFLVMLATAGAMGSAGVLIQPLETEFGWTSAQISSALAIRFVLFGLLGPFAAAFMNRFGVRQVVMSALVLIVAGIVGSMFMRELWQLLALWGIVVGRRHRHDGAGAGRDHGDALVRKAARPRRRH